MTALATIAPKLAKLLSMLASPMDGEVVAAARAIDRTLKAAGATIHDLAAALEPAPPSVYRPGRDQAEADWFDLVKMILRDGERHLNPKERAFVVAMRTKARYGDQPSEKQEAWIRSLAERVKLAKDFYYD